MEVEPITLKPHYFRDLAEGIQQQMFFWGQDVIRSDGNLLVKNGFERSASKGLKGTSCYRKSWQGGHIELYGSCAGWYGSKNGFSFIRPQRRCVVWKSANTTPIPGAWQKEYIDKSVSKYELYTAALPFLDWLIAYESSVINAYGASYRYSNYLSYKKVAKAKCWIKPKEALAWFQCFRKTPENLVRPKNISLKSYV